MIEPSLLRDACVLVPSHLVFLGLGFLLARRRYLQVVRLHRFDRYALRSPHI